MTKRKLPECLECGTTIGFKKIQLCDKHIENLIKLIKKYTDENENTTAKDVIEHIINEEKKRYMSMKILDVFIEEGRVILDNNSVETKVESEIIQKSNFSCNQMAKIYELYEKANEENNIKKVSSGMHHSLKRMNKR